MCLDPHDGPRWSLLVAPMSRCSSLVWLWYSSVFWWPLACLLVGRLAATITEECWKNAERRSVNADYELKH